MVFQEVSSLSLQAVIAPLISYELDANKVDRACQDQKLDGSFSISRTTNDFFPSKSTGNCTSWSDVVTTIRSWVVVSSVLAIIVIRLFVPNSSQIWMFSSGADVVPT
jgi:hypothetical protein